MAATRELIPATKVAQSICLVRGQKVMLDFELAHLYGVRTKALNPAVKRHRHRFPRDFMFQLTAAEMSNLKSQFVTSRNPTADEFTHGNRSQFVTGSLK